MTLCLCLHMSSMPAVAGTQCPIPAIAACLVDDGHDVGSQARHARERHLRQGHGWHAMHCLGAWASQGN